MSAFISASSVDEICLLSDGAGYDNDGIIREIGCKIHTSKTVPFAMTGRGSRFLVNKVCDFLTDMADRAGVDTAIDVFEGSIPEMASTPRAEGADYIHLHLAAWSPTKGLVRYSFHNLPYAFSSGEKGMRLNEVGGVYSAGNVCSMDDYVACGVGPRLPGMSLSAFLKANGAGMMEAMRRKPATLLRDDTSTAKFLIGGQCDLLSLTRDGTHIETLRTWPDKIGEPIDPFSATDSTVVKLNRHQRRAAKAA